MLQNGLGHHNCHVPEDQQQRFAVVSTLDHSGIPIPVDPADPTGRKQGLVSIYIEPVVRLKSLPI